MLVKAKIHDQFFYQFLLTNPFIPVFITSRTERLYIYCSLNENLSTSSLEENLYFVAFNSKNVTTDCLTDEQKLIKKLIVYSSLWKV